MTQVNKQKGNTLVGLLVVVAALFILPWNRIDWGRMSFGQDRVVTVVGEARSQEKNEVASFSAGVSAVNDEKDKAIDEVNENIEKIIAEVKKFGIEEGDIKTQSMSVYQSEESYWDGGVQKMRKGQWRVDNQIEVVLRDIAKASELTKIFTENGANNVYGPNFRIDDTSKAEEALFDEAIKNAREKAEIIAKASDRELGKVVSVTEGTSNYGVYPLSARMEGAGGAGFPMEGGSTTVSKSVTVVFELK
jgi:hypothetical protein